MSGSVLSRKLITLRSFMTDCVYLFSLVLKRLTVKKQQGQRGGRGSTTTTSVYHSCTNRMMQCSMQNKQMQPPQETVYIWSHGAKIQVTVSDLSLQIRNSPRAVTRNWSKVTRGILYFTITTCILLIAQQFIYTVFFIFSHSWRTLGAWWLGGWHVCPTPTRYKVRGAIPVSSMSVWSLDVLPLPWELFLGSLVSSWVQRHALRINWYFYCVRLCPVIDQHPVLAVPSQKKTQGTPRPTEILIKINA